MYDNVKLFVFNFTLEEFEELKVLLSKDSIIDRHQSESFDLGNLRFNYYPNQQKLRIRNSLHKFYNGLLQGLDYTNSTVFKYEQFTEVVEYLCSILKRKSKEIIVGGDTEFGVNIYLPNNFNIMNIISRYEYYKSTSVNPFTVDKPYRGKPYQVSCALSNFRMKFYHKTKQENITNNLYNILRFEIVVHNIRMLRQILLLQCPNTITLEDLVEYDNWCALANFLEEIYEYIVKKPILKPGTQTHLGQLTLIHTLLDYHFYLDVKEYFPEQFREFRKVSEEYRAINEYYSSNLHNDVRDYLDKALYDTLSI